MFWEKPKEQAKEKIKTKTKTKEPQKNIIKKKSDHDKKHIEDDEKNPFLEENKEEEPKQEEIQIEDNIDEDEEGGNILLIEFLEVINLFEFNARKPYKETNLLYHSIYDFISPYFTFYEDLNKELLKHIFPKLGKEADAPTITVYDDHNLMLIRALVDNNYKILLRMFNEVPFFISQKIDLHPKNPSFYSLKVLFFLSTLKNHHVTLDQSILNFLIAQLDEKSKIKEMIGLDLDFFKLLCSSNEGNFTVFLAYLAFQDEKYLMLASLYCWFYAPFISHIYSMPNTNLIEIKMALSVLLIYGIFNVLQIYYDTKGKNLMEYLPVQKMKKFLQEKIRDIFHYISQEIEHRPLYNINWFSFNIPKFLCGIDLDFTEYLKKNEKKKQSEENEDGYEYEYEEPEEPVKKEDLYENVCSDFKEKFGNDFGDLIEKIKLFFQSKFTEGDMQYPNLLINFFSKYFYGASGLSKNSNLNFDQLLEQPLNKSDNILMQFLDLHLKKLNEFSFPTHFDEKLKIRLKTYHSLIQLSMVGFHIIEKQKIYQNSQAEEFINQILNNA